jgi:hypothetical protein
LQEGASLEMIAKNLDVLKQDKPKLGVVLVFALSFCALPLLFRNSRAFIFTVLIAFAMAASIVIAYVFIVMRSNVRKVVFKERMLSINGTDVDFVDLTGIVIIKKKGAKERFLILKNKLVRIPFVFPLDAFIGHFKKNDLKLKIAEVDSSKPAKAFLISSLAAILCYFLFKAISAPLAGPLFSLSFLIAVILANRHFENEIIKLHALSAPPPE